MTYHKSQNGCYLSSIPWTHMPRKGFCREKMFMIHGLYGRLFDNLFARVVCVISHRRSNLPCIIVSWFVFCWTIFLSGKNRRVLRNEILIIFIELKYNCDNIKYLWWIHSFNDTIQHLTRQIIAVCVWMNDESNQEKNKHKHNKSKSVNQKKKSDENATRWKITTTLGSD